MRFKSSVFSPTNRFHISPPTVRLSSTLSSDRRELTAKPSPSHQWGGKLLQSFRFPLPSMGGDKGEGERMRPENFFHEFLGRDA